MDLCFFACVYSLCPVHQIEKTLRAAGKSHLFTRLSYPGAGHLIEPPYSPMSRASFWVIKPEKRESSLHVLSTGYCFHLF